MAYLPKPSIVRPPKNAQLCGPREDEFEGGGGDGGGYDNGGGDGGYNNNGEGEDEYRGPGGPGGPGFGPGGPGFGPGGPGFGPGGPGFGPGGPGFGPGGPGFGPGGPGPGLGGPGPGYGPGGGPRPGGFSLASAYAPVVVAHNSALDDIEPEGPSTGKLLKGFIKSKAGLGLLVVVVVVAAVAGALAGGGGSSSSGGGGGSGSSNYYNALATFVPSTTTSGIAGTVAFKQLRTGDATVTITVALTSNGEATIPSGLHGFHIHATSATGAGSTACDVAGAHFNPQSVQHGLPTSAVRHVGDLGNVNADANGKITYTFTDSKISLRPGDLSNIINRAIMLHAYMDDGGVGPNTGSNCGASSNMNCTSSTTGNAGPRLACAAIVST